MVKNYIPEKGDIVIVNMDPQVGKEQAWIRPAIILSLKKYNEIVGLAVVCPITNKIKGYPFEVKLQRLKTQGVILTDHIKNIDWKIRKIKFIEKANKDTLDQVAEKLNALLEFGQ